MGRKFLLLLASIAAAGVVWGIAGKTDNNWRAVGGSADGAWDDVSRWSLGVMPGADHYARFPGGLGSYTVTFPEGDVDVATSFRANVVAGETLTLDGRGSNFLQGERESDTYYHEPFGFRYEDRHFFNHQLYNEDEGDSAIARHAFSEMTNFIVRLSGANASPELYFDQGFLNLYDPCSSTSSSNALTILFAQGAQKHADPYAYTGKVSFGDGTATRFGQMYIQGNNRTNILEFTGGKHEFLKQVQVPSANQSMVDTETFTQIRVADRAEVVFKGQVWFGDWGSTYGGTSMRKFNILVENGGYCALSNTVSQKTGGNLHLSARNGGVLEISQTATLAHLAACTASVTVANATLNAYADLNLGNSKLNCTLTATNSTLVATGTIMQVSSVAEFVDSALTLSGQYNLTGDSRAVFSGEKAVTALSRPLHIGNTSSGDNEVEFAGGNHNLTGSMYIGQIGRGKIKVSGGTLNNLSGAGSAFTYLGVEENASGEIVVSGGTFNAPGSYGIQVGYKGLGKVSVSGGEIKTPRIRLGTFNSTSQKAEDVFEQSGGLVSISGQDDQYGLYVAIYPNRKARVSLVGGVLKCGRIAAGAGVADFLADGGKIEVPAANASFFYGFRLAELGPKGLEILSGHDVTAAQAFAQSENGGRLKLSGGGTKTFTASDTSLGAVEVSGGKAIFPGDVAGLGNVTLTGGGTIAFSGEMGDNAVSSLVLGDEAGPGILEVAPGKPFKVAGNVVVNSAKIVFSGDFSSGENGCAYQILEFGGEMDEASRKRLAVAFAEGLAAGDVADFSIAGEAGSLKIVATVRKRNDLAIELGAGASNATQNINFAIDETLAVTVGKEALLTLGGQYGVGRLVKEGPGKATLSASGSVFAGGALVAGGMLSVADASALWPDDNPLAGTTVLSNGTLEVVAPREGVRITKPLAFISAPTNITASASIVYKGRAAVAIKSEVPLTMPVPSPALAAFMKRGVASLTVEADGEVGFPSERGHDTFSFSPSGTFVFDEYGNIPENCVYPAVSIVEGELRLKGTGAQPAQFGIHGSLMLSVPTKSVAVQPSLVLDNARLINKDDGTRSYLGFGSRNANSAVSEVTLVLTNNSVFSGDTISVNQNSSAGAKARISAHSSKFIATYQLNAGYGSSPDIVYSFSAGSELLAARFGLNKTVLMDFDSSRCAKNQNLDPVGIIANESAPSRFNFRNSSEFYCNSIKTHASVAQAALTLMFDDSRWIPGGGDCDFGGFCSPGVNVVVEGHGLVLEPPADKTWTMNLPVSGSGGLVVGGAGRVVLDVSQWSAQGPVAVGDAATLDLGGEAAGGVYVSGGGRVENGSLAGGGIALSLKDDGSVAGGVPLLDSVDCSGRVKVKVDLCDETLREPYATCVIARYEGTAPDVSGWRMARIPGFEKLGAKFEAVDGAIFMTPCRKGLMITVR